MNKTKKNDIPLNLENCSVHDRTQSIPFLSSQFICLINEHLVENKELRKIPRENVLTLFLDILKVNTFWKKIIFLSCSSLQWMDNHRKINKCVHNT